MSEQKPDTVYFPAFLHIVPVITFFLLFFGFTAIEKFSALFILILIINTGVFAYQLYFLSTIATPRRVYKAERDLLIGSLLILGGLLAGHLMGYAKFSDGSTGLGEGLVTVIAAYLYILALLTLILSIANVFYLYLTPSKVLYGIGKVGLFILWLLMFVIAFFGYSLAYAIQDPSTE